MTTPTAPQSSLPALHWLIRAELEVLTPLHLGTGTDRRITPVAPDADPYWQADIALDADDKPYLPGASLKGALKALARRSGLDAPCLPLFGDLHRGTAPHPTGIPPRRTRAGLAEFRDALRSHKAKTNEATQTDDADTAQPRIAIDRVTGSVVDKKLFRTKTVPIGTRFGIEIILRHADENLAAQLVALLQHGPADPDFRLGAHANLGFGRVGLYGNIDTRRFGPQQAQHWFAAAQTQADARWTDFAEAVTLTAPALAQPAPRRLALPLSLAFHTPFLVKQAASTGDKPTDAPDGTPRQRGDRALLPGASLRGRLRSQAERILRTLGCEVAQGHAVPPVKTGTCPDPATLLFGAAGWRGLLRTDDCTGTAPATLVDHDMLAIDRFTGGGKDGAKFKLRYAECPTLEGQLSLDLSRLRSARLDGANAADTPWIALGLLTLVLRDLAEGDIPFGHGSAKGYGRCRAQGLPDRWRQALEAPFGPNADTRALAALRAWCRTHATAALDAPCSLAGSAPTPAAAAPSGQAAPADAFHNPYHFIPFSQPDIDRWLSPDAHRKTGGHSRYRGLSGRLVCALTTVTPLFVGAAARTPASDQHPKPVAGFALQNQPAIPATSLRGLLSSLFESISGSNLRVLHPTPYSIRKTTKEALSAIGRIVERNGELKLYPLTLPTIHRNADNAYPVPARWRKVFYWESPVPLRVYFGSRKQTYDSRQPHYLPIQELSYLPNDSDCIDPDQGDLRFPSSDRDRKFLIGQRPISRYDCPIPETDLPKLSPQERPPYTRGWVRSLWTSNREKELPRTVKHQLFIPDPVETPADDDLLPIPQGVLDTFHALADLALAGQHWGKDDTPADDQLLPFTPAGRQRHDADRQTRLQPGDLVCFDLGDDGAVSEISFSSIWREGLRLAGKPNLATTADLLAQVSPHLLPLGMPGRSERLSPVEQLFGVVEYRPPQAAKGTRKPTDAPAAYALAGKVHVGYGRPARSFERAPAVTLKELSTPKPPSPALYFRPKAGDGYVSKADLARQPQNYAPAGRKHYLHALRQQGQVAHLNDKGRVANDGTGRKPWQSRFDGIEDKGNKRRVRVEPIPAGETFHFEIDFDNLNPTELEQLCATLLPHPAFEHRLGMGKPIGLGSVKLAVEGLLLVDRPRRYAEDEPNAPRHHRGWRANADAGWPDHLQGDSPAAPLEAAEQPAALAERAMARVPADVRRALQLLGNPGAVAAPVHYPQVKDAQIEKEHYLWFVANDDKNTVGGNRHLPRLHADSPGLPTLPRLVKRERGHPPNTGKPRRE